MSVWSTRRARALALTGDAPHAGEILRCYAQLLEVQEQTAARVPIARWLAMVQAAEGEVPRVRLERLPMDELVPLFDGLLAAMTEVGTRVMTAETERLRRVSSAERRQLLGAAPNATSGEGDGPPFHVRALFEATVTPLAARILPNAEPPEGATSGRCHTCGAPPVVATLRDLPGALGSRGLVCGLCGTEQRIRRLTCAHCGETAADQLHVHSPESLPHVRVDECASCSRYIKTVDLRQRGDAVPLVDDMATVELDLWALERGLTKVSKNLFGI